MILLMPNKECYHVTYLKFVCYRMSYNESLILQQTKYNKLNRKRIAGPGIEPLDEQATFTVRCIHDWVFKDCTQINYAI